jgi:redox-sensitive bicupin YhaK (pirin superfamily)
MSRRSDTVSAEECTALGAAEQRLESYPNRELRLGSLTVSRALPVRDKRFIGPWCFLDRFGPLTFGDGKPMDVAPHPHIGLQTVTWLLDGEIVHDDSLGFESVLRPGGVNVMTSGAGIAHAEQTPPENSGTLNGVQLWVALPDRHRHAAPGFDHRAEVPIVESAGGLAHVFAGVFEDAGSAGPYYSDLLGVDLQIHRRRAFDVPLNPKYEYGALVMDGVCTLNGERLEPRMLYYLGTTRTAATFSSDEGGRVLLIGGPPFGETILMWWNFVARTPEEIAEARTDWEERRRFGEVAAYKGPRLGAPALARFARANPVS